MDREPPRIPDYALLRRIGAGSYGEVWLARAVTGAYRAVKVIYRDSFEDERPFQREFNGIQRFEPVSRRHDSQVDLLHVGQGDGFFYYVMELADDEQSGSDIHPDSYRPRTLRSEINQRGPLPAEECVEIGLALTTALDHLHQNGLIHRDIKPANIIFVNGIPKLADIGLVASAAETRSFVGTQGFFPPEGPGTPQADLYSLGKVIYEMCTGLDRQEFPELPTLLMEQPGREALLELNAIIAKACRIKSEQRYASAREMHADLSLLQSGRSIRRMRSIEHRLAWLTRVGIAALLLGTLMAGAFLFQRHQTNTARQLAADNRKLAEENQRVAEESRSHLMRLQTANATRLLAQEDPLGAALWYAENLRLSQNNSEQAALHRLRLEWVLRDAPALQFVFPHTGSVKFARLSPDASRIFTASEDHTARLWDAKSGHPLCPPLVHPRGVSSAAFSPDGKHAASGSWGKAFIWSGTNGNPIASLEHTRWVDIVTFNPTSDRLLTATSAGSVRIWDAATGEPLMFFPGHTGAVTCAAWSPDGRKIMTGSADKTAKLWDANTGKLLLDIERPYPIDKLDFRSDGRWALLATGRAPGPNAAQFWLWNLHTGQPIYSSARYPANGIGFAKFSQDSWQVLLGASPLVVFNLSTNRPRVEVPSQVALRSIDLARNGDIVATGSERNGLAYLWNRRTGQNMVPPLKHSGYVNDVQLSPDNSKLLTASDEGVARLWSIPTNQPGVRTLRHPANVWSAVWSPDGKRILTAAIDGTARLWDAASGELVLPPLTNHTPICMAIFSADGRRILTSASNAGRFRFGFKDLTQVMVWDAQTGKPIGQPLIHNTNVLAVAIRGDGQCIATGTSDGQVRVWDAQTKELLSREMKHKDEVLQVSFSKDGTRLLSCSADATAKVWDWARGRSLIKTLRHDNAIQGAVFSHDEKRIATIGLDQTGRVWDAPSGKPLTPPFRHRGRLFHLAFAPSDRLLVTTGLSGKARVWHVATGEPAVQALEHEQAVNDASFHPSAPILLTGSNDHTARLWDLTTGEPLTPPLKHENGIVMARFAPDGRSFLTVCGTASVRVWQMPSGSSSLEELLQRTQLLSGHRMTKSGALVPLSSEILRQYAEKFRLNGENSRK